jgi:hypothetical protein
MHKIPHSAEHNLYQRINAVQREVGYLKKDKTVDNRYTVATYDNMIGEVRDALIEHGIVVETRFIRGQAVESGGTSKNGAKWIRYEAEYSVAFVNIDRPDDRSEMSVSAHADDSGDKGPGKAQTYATKAIIKKVLMLETGDDEEVRKPEPKPISGAQTAKDAFDAMSPEQKDFLSSHAREIIKIFSDPSGDTMTYWHAQHFDTDDKLAIWSLLPSNVRSFINAQTKGKAA